MDLATYRAVTLQTCIDLTESYQRLLTQAAIRHLTDPEWSMLTALKQQLAEAWIDRRRALAGQLPNAEQPLPGQPCPRLPR